MIAIKYDEKNNYFELDDKTTSIQELLTLAGIIIDMCQVASDNKLTDEAMLEYMKALRKDNIKGVVMRTGDKEEE